VVGSEEVRPRGLELKHSAERRFTAAGRRSRWGAAPLR
jgi:hypothetical protein